MSVPAEGLGADFVEVLEAVGRIVRKHPGLSVMVAPADGRTSQAVIRVSERHGKVETAVIRPPSQAPHPGSGDPAFDGNGATAPAGAAADGGWNGASSDVADLADDADGEETVVVNVPVGWNGDERHPAPGAQLGAADHADLADDPELGDAAGMASRISVPESTSRVVSRLAQLLREDPSLVASWARDEQ